MEKVESSLAKCLNMGLIRGELIFALIDQLINLNRTSIFNYQPIGKGVVTKTIHFQKKQKINWTCKSAFKVCSKHFNDPVPIVT